VILAFGAIFEALATIEGDEWTYLDCVYFGVISLTTIGLGDFSLRWYGDWRYFEVFAFILFATVGLVVIQELIVTIANAITNVLRALNDEWHDIWEHHVITRKAHIQGSTTSLGILSFHSGHKLHGPVHYMHELRAIRAERDSLLEQVSSLTKELSEYPGTQAGETSYVYPGTQLNPPEAPEAGTRMADLSPKSIDVDVAPPATQAPSPAAVQAAVGRPQLVPGLNAGELAGRMSRANAAMSYQQRRIGTLEEQVASMAAERDAALSHAAVLHAATQAPSPTQQAADPARDVGGPFWPSITDE